MSSSLRRARTRVARTGLAVLGSLLFASTALAVPAADADPAALSSAAVTARATRAADDVPVTPGDFTGYGFDQCLAPTQATMDAWLSRSPYLAVGIYISGDSRACREQPNLTPTWVRRQLLSGWRLLPITLGPQASCQPRFPRYADDFRISAYEGRGRYPRAREMGRDSGATSVRDARALGIRAGSTLWYDLEGFDLGNTACRESALAFLSAWVSTVKGLGFATGVYSSAGSGIKALDDARVARPRAFALPDHIWVARWDGVADTSTSYIRDDGWRPGRRVKQYRGGHDEVWGGVRINIDTNYLDLGAGSIAAREQHCGGARVGFRHYPTLRADGTAPADRVRALQCLLREKDGYRGALHGRYDAATVSAVRAWKTAHGRSVDDRWYRQDWMTLLAAGLRPVLKVGSADGYVRRVQRTLNAADRGPALRVFGRYDASTAGAVRAYQGRVGLPATGIVDRATWDRLQAGVR